MEETGVKRKLAVILVADAEGFWPHMVRSMRVVLEDESCWSSIWAEHAAIAEAVISGDVERAGDLGGQHAEKAGETTDSRLKEI